MTAFYRIAKSGPARIKSVEAENYGQVEGLPDFSDWRCPGLNGEDGDMSPSAIRILGCPLTPGTVVSDGARRSITYGIVRHIVFDMPPSFDIGLQLEPAIGGTINLRPIEDWKPGSISGSSYIGIKLRFQARAWIGKCVR
jgi:hypothetical protein